MVFLAISCSFFLTSCFSYHSQLDKYSRQAFNEIKKPNAYVINKAEFSKEFNILKKSNLYSLTEDSTTNLKIKLFELRPMIQVRCMTGPVTVLLFTLGQFPVRVPESYVFLFEEIENNKINSFKYELNIDKRIWFWDIFSWKKSRTRELALSMRHKSVKK